MTEKILNLADKQQTSLDKDGASMSALFQYEGKGLNMGMERDVIQIFLLNQGFRNLITGKSARRSCVEWRILFQNRKFRWKTTVFDLLGKLIDETEYMSSDIYHEEIGENKEEEKQSMYNLHHPYQLFFFTSY